MKTAGGSAARLSPGRPSILPGVLVPSGADPIFGASLAGVQDRARGPYVRTHRGFGLRRLARSRGRQDAAGQAPRRARTRRVRSRHECGPRPRRGVRGTNCPAPQRAGWISGRGGGRHPWRGPGALGVDGRPRPPPYRFRHLVIRGPGLSGVHRRSVRGAIATIAWLLECPVLEQDKSSLNDRHGRKADPSSHSAAGYT